MNYYNDNDLHAAAWLRELINAKLIPDGEVDTRSISDVTARDVGGYIQCHFFAGIGGWSEALRLADWDSNRPAWTGSCPCQPFSVAGKRKGAGDVRHLWPEFLRLIAECRPPTVFGEQVAGKDGRKWLAGVRSDLEALGYGVGASDLCAAGVGAPHPRQRLYWGADWVADSRHKQKRRSAGPSEAESGRTFGESSGCGDAFGLADMQREGLEEWAEQPARQEREAIERSGDAGWVGDPSSTGSGRNPRAVLSQETEGQGEWSPVGCVTDKLVSSSAWSDYEIIPCADGKARRIESGTFPLAHGVPHRVAKLRGLGNAIVPQVAAEFIQAFLEC